MSLKFIPPKEKSLPKYASYAKGVMRTHTSLGHAKQSLAYRAVDYVDYSRDYPLERYSESFILELVDGEWYILYHVKKGTAANDLPWKKEFLDGIEYGSPVSVRSDGLTKDSIEWHKSNGYVATKKNVAISKEEYAEWRIKVELESRGIES